MVGSLTSVLLAAVAASPTTAEAAPVVLSASSGEGSAPGPADAAVVAKEQLGDVEVILGGASTLLNLAANPARLPAAPPVGCAGSPAPRTQLEGLLTTAVDALDSLEYADSLRAATQARDLLPCVQDVVGTDSLYRLYFTEGLAAFYNDDATSAAAAFHAATAVDSTRPWNDDYAPEPQGVFLAALQGVLKTPGAPVDVDPTLVNPHIDGRPVSGRVDDLPAGPHLVQVGAAGSARGVIVFVPGGAEPVPLLGPAGLEAALARGDEAVAVVLAAAARSEGWTESILIVSDLGWVRFEPSTGRFEGRSGSVSAAPAASRPPLPLGIALMAGGAGVAAAGFAANRVEFTLAANAGDAEEYRRRYQDHLGGFAAGVAGCVAVGVGLGVTLAATVGPKQSASRGPVVLPFAFAAPGTAGAGLTGRF